MLLHTQINKVLNNNEFLLTQINDALNSHEYLHT